MATTEDQVNSSTTKILVVDNYDSFVYNLVQYLEQLGAQVDLVRNDQVNFNQLKNYDGILISPGPGNPANAGESLQVVKWAAENNKPLFGVCLGHQAIGEYFGSIVDRAPELLHGKISQISKVNHDNQKNVLRNLPNSFAATRYHSLAIKEESLTSELIVTGRSESGVIMAVKHKNLPIEGVQFHPESILTEYGYLILANWLEDCGNTKAVEISKTLSPLINY